ncbi:MAG: hypothetical protein V4520_02360 [Bacteroidota bacterium]
MKKILLLTVLLTGRASAASAQSAIFNPDSSVTYLKNNFKKGQEVQLFYGSDANKNFKFVELINFDLVHHPKMQANYSKQKFNIDYVYVKDGKCTIRGKAPWSDCDGNFVVVDVEGAIDNKEIVAPDNITQPAKKITVQKKVRPKN